jgi:carbamate kinase
MRGTIRDMARLYTCGNTVVVTHGNGPQVGSELEKNELASRKVPELPLYYLTAETQSVMGSAIEIALRSALPARQSKGVCTVLSHTLVNPKDPLFKRPTKPIGPFMTHAELKAELALRAFDYYERGGMYRRIVPSPKPIRVLEAEIIKQLSKSRIVICGGGGGIPLIKKGPKYIGADAVIDKDLTTALIANEIGAEKMVILTDSEYLYSDYGHRSGPISHITLKALKMLANRLEEGTMKPKVWACINFIEHGGKEAYIGNVYELGRIMKRLTGTRITR